MSDKRYFTEMDEPYTPPPWDPGGSGPRGRLKALLARLKTLPVRLKVGLQGLGARLHPSLWFPARGAWLLFGLWLLLALMTSQILGAFLTPTFEAPWQVFAVTFGLAFGLPLLLAPRPTREPLAWGIGLNVLALTALALLARPTSRALHTHGHWEIDWLEERGSNEVAIGLASTMASFTRWGVAQVPIEQLEAQFGDLKDQAGAPAGLQGEQASEAARARSGEASKGHVRPSGPPPDDEMPGGRVRDEGSPENTGPGSASGVALSGGAVRSSDSPEGAGNRGTAGASSGHGGAAGANGHPAGADGHPTGAEGRPVPNDAEPDLEPRDSLQKKIDDAKVLANPDDPYWRDLAHSPTSATVARQEKRLLELVNLERIRHGLSSLPLRADLCRLARAHSESMSAAKNLSHVDSHGKGPKERARAMLKEDWDVEEAIAKTPQAGDTARDLINLMLRTPDERGAILDDETSYRGIGVGMACDGPTCYATVLFLK